jgi:hypothetical protein
MATEEFTPNKNAAPTDPEQGRMIFALESAWEIEVLSGLLLEKAASDEWELEAEQSLLLRSIGVRMQELSRVVMSAISDPIEPTDSLHERLFGSRPVNIEGEVCHG